MRTEVGSAHAPRINDPAALSNQHDIDKPGFAISRNQCVKAIRFCLSRSSARQRQKQHNQRRVCTTLNPDDETRRLEKVRKYSSCGGVTLNSTTTRHSPLKNELEFARDARLL